MSRRGGENTGKGSGNGEAENRAGNYYGNRRRFNNNIQQKMGEEKSLASKQLDMQNKVLLVDIKQNDRGKFVKLSEKVGSQFKSRITMTLSSAYEFLEALDRLIDTYSKLEPHDPVALTERSMAQPTLSGEHPQVPSHVEGRIRTETLTLGRKRFYYLDLKENQQGRFLRITMVTSQRRVSLSIPAQGMSDLHETLSTMFKEHCTEDDLKGDRSDLLSQMQSKSIRTDNKRFFFDVGVSRAGMYLRISEVRRTYRTAITLPEYKWENFRELLDFYIEKSGSFKEINGRQEEDEVKPEAEVG